MRIFLRLLTADGLRSLLKELGQDKIIPHIKMPILVSRLPRWIRSVIVFFIRYIVRDNLYADFGCFDGTDVSDRARRSARASSPIRRQVEPHHVARPRARCAYRTPPSLAGRTPRRSYHTSTMAGSTLLYNIVDASVALLPVLRVDPARDSHRKKTTQMRLLNRRQTTNDGHRSCVGRRRASSVTFLCTARSTMQEDGGLPVGVQVVTRPYHEEKAIGIMRLVDDALPSPASRDLPGRTFGRSRQLHFGRKARSAVGFGPGILTKALFQ